MPKKIIVIGIILLLGSWLVIGEKRSPLEKIGLLLGVIAAYVGFRVLSGASLEQALAPLVFLFTE